MSDFLTQFLDNPGDLYAPGSSSAPVLPPTQTSAQAPQTASPSALDLMAAAGTPAPSLPQADLSSLTPLTLLQFAASIAQPKQLGQSNMGKFAQSLAGAAAYNMNERKAMEDRVVEQELQKRKLAATDAQLEQARLGNIKTRQDITQSEQRNPLELERLRATIDSAKSETDLRNIQIRVAKIKEQYAQQEEEAALAERSAKTDQEKAAAMMQRSHAQLLQRQAEELVNLAQMRLDARNQPSYQLKEGMPGEPPRLIDTKSGALYSPPMSPADALDYAKRQVKAMKEAEGFANSTEEKLAVQKIYRQALAGNLPTAATGASSSTGTQRPPAATAQQPQGSGMDKDYQTLLEKTAPFPNSTAVYADPKTGKVTLIKGGQPEKIYPNLAAFQKEYTIQGDKVVPNGGATTTPPAPTGASAALKAQYAQEQREMDAGTRTDFSPEVKAMFNTLTIPQMSAEEFARRQRMLDQTRRGM